MSYAKTFMEDYLEYKQIVYKPIPINYIIYNTKTKKFRSNKMPSSDNEEHTIEILDNEINFTIFISHPIEEEYFFIELMDNDTIENRIYDYYDFYDIRKSEITIVQDYSVFIDFQFNVYNITTTKYSSEKKLDTFEVVHFSKLGR